MKVKVFSIFKYKKYTII